MCIWKHMPCSILYRTNCHHRNVIIHTRYVENDISGYVPCERKEPKYTASPDVY